MAGCNPRTRVHRLEGAASAQRDGDEQNTQGPRISPPFRVFRVFRRPKSASDSRAAGHAQISRRGPADTGAWRPPRASARCDEAFGLRNVRNARKGGIAHRPRNRRGPALGGCVASAAGERASELARRPPPTRHARLGLPSRAASFARRSRLSGGLRDVADEAWRGGNTRTCVFRLEGAARAQRDGDEQNTQGPRIPPPLSRLSRIS